MDEEKDLDGTGGYEPGEYSGEKTDAVGMINLMPQEALAYALRAGEVALRRNSDEFEDGTRLGAYDYVVQEIVTAFLSASNQRRAE
jgi:hypothetical protein